MVRTVEPEVARAAKALWPSAASSSATTLIDVNARLPRGRHTEQLVSRSFKLFSSLDPQSTDSLLFMTD
jgi:hypothetical protein